MVDPGDESDPYRLAEIELSERKVPFIVRRYLPDGSYEDWKASELYIEWIIRILFCLIIYRRIIDQAWSLFSALSVSMPSEGLVISWIDLFLDLSDLTSSFWADSFAWSSFYASSGTTPSDSDYWSDSASTSGRGREKSNFGSVTLSTVALVRTTICWLPAPKVLILHSKNILGWTS